MTQQNIVSEDEKKSSEDNLLDGMKNILNRGVMHQLIDIDPVRCRLELSSVMKILTDLIEEKDESDFEIYISKRDTFPN